jgi:hypothetical protein
MKIFIIKYFVFSVCFCITVYLHGKFVVCASTFTVLTFLVYKTDMCLLKCYIDVVIKIEHADIQDESVECEALVRVKS